MSGVYGWMTGGLCLTGFVAWNVSGNPQLVQTFSATGAILGFDHRPTRAVISLSWLINRISGAIATLIYFLYAGLTGLTLSSIFLIYTAPASRQCSASRLLACGLSGFGS